MPIFADLAQTVGHTPLVDLSRFAAKMGIKARVLGKLESRNPTGSVKDRIAIAMIRDAEKRGELAPGSMIVSASSGNTGIALASACAALGYRITIVMPESMSRQRVAMLSMLGATVELTPGSLMGHAVDRAEEILKVNKKAVRLHQFENPANPQAHYETTGPEIWADADGEVDLLVAGVGTGGTLTGVGRFLKEQQASIRVIAVEPEPCAVLSGKRPGPHRIQGLGPGFIPAVLDRELIDEVLTVSEDAATETAVLLAQTEGILAGISTGANLAAVARIAAREPMHGKTIVTILCDTGERYLNSELADEALR